MQKRTKHRLLILAILPPIHLALWMAFTCTPSRAEWVVGCIAALVAVFPAAAFLFCARLHFRPTWTMLAEGIHIPLNVIRGTADVFQALFRQLFSSAGADHRLAMIPFRTQPRNGRTAAARALALFYSMTSPNFIVIGYDIKGQRMLFHQIVKGPVSDMTRRLGEGR